MENKWPEKKTHKPLPFIVIPEGHELNDLMKHNYEVGWNACHEQFMKVINEQKKPEPDRNCDKDWFGETC